MLLMMMEEASCIQGIQEMVTITILLSRWKCFSLAAT
jgi:hypothetical protein